MQVVCAKVREGDKRIVRIKEGNPEGRHVVIVDDLVQSGGTLRECQVSTYQAITCLTALCWVSLLQPQREVNHLLFCRWLQFHAIHFLYLFEI
jgi:hypoxanthine-guanine phosphoribosyltransferase